MMKPWVEQNVKIVGKWQLIHIEIVISLVEANSIIKFVPGDCQAVIFNDGNSL